MIDAETIDLAKERQRRAEMTRDWAFEREQERVRELRRKHVWELVYAAIGFTLALAVLLWAGGGR